MSEGGGAGGGFVAAVSAGITAAKQMWEVFILPAGALGFGVAKWIGARRDKQDADRLTETQRRESAWDAKLARADQQVQAHVAWQEARAVHAEARAREAEARCDAAEREQRRLEIQVERYEHALGTARQIADDARAEQGKPKVDWKPVARPRLQGDPPA